MTVDQIPIGKFSVLTRISPKALRYYDSKGLLVPEAKDTITGYRNYTAGQLERGVKIRTLTLLGFSLDDISAPGPQYLSLPGPVSLLTCVCSDGIREPQSAMNMDAPAVVRNARRDG